MTSVEAQGPAVSLPNRRSHWRSNLIYRLHILVADVLYFSGILPLWLAWQKRFRKGRVWVITLHRVLSAEHQQHTASPPGMLMEQATFAALLDCLKRHFSVVALAECFEKDGTRAYAKPACILTFDDGWGDNYHFAYPELKKRDIPATIFLTTGYIEGDTYPWWEGLCSRRHELRGNFLGQDGGLDGFLEQLIHMSKGERAEAIASIAVAESSTDEVRSRVDGMLRWEHVQEMARHGIEFGAHTMTHPLLTAENASTVASELVGSKVQIERRLGIPVRSFAYPSGAWNKSVREAVAEAGFELGFTTDFGPYQEGMDPLTVPRITLHQGTVSGRSGQFSRAMLLLTLTGWDRLRRC